MSEREAIVMLKETMDVIASSSRLEAPRESCGLIVWDRMRAHHLLTLADNVADGRNDYAVDPEHHLSWYRKDGVDIDGVWHSHVATPAELSRIDVHSSQPGLLYMIYSVSEDRAAAWRCVDEGDMLAFVPVDIQIL